MLPVLPYKIGCKLPVKASGLSLADRLDLPRLSVCRFDVSIIAFEPCIVGVVHLYLRNAYSTKVAQLLSTTCCPLGML